MRIDLNDAQSTALATVLRNALITLQGAGKVAAGDFGELKEGYVVLHDLYRRLTGLDVSHKEADFLADVIEQTLAALEKQDEVSPVPGVDMQKGEGLLRDLHKQVKLTEMQLADQEVGTLAIILANAKVSLLKGAKMDNDPDDVRVFQKGAHVVDELSRRLLGVDLDEDEASYLKTLIGLTVPLYEPLKKGLGADQQKNLEQDINRLHAIQERIQPGSLDLNGAENLALRLALQNAAFALNRAVTGEKDATAQKSLKKGLEVTQDLQRRLRTLELTSTETEFLRGVVESTYDALESLGQVDPTVLKSVQALHYNYLRAPQASK